ncbi:sensor histidine kinase [Colwellia psychrerythraea]|uniref:Sensor histidine kinase n=1 Tax=Colwellia psychrerythraea (strain 34H / ATCC BAA-681) TaxID=167879 RepID=Q484G5_COLP3|nr:histidine kinase [Colwellia psychrerythraea]AAZ27339.1 sensor histidine kinase [Colwellia psychrerythraea 34H]
MQTLKALLHFYSTITAKQILIGLVSLSIVAFFITQTAIADRKESLSWEPWLLEYSAVYCYGLVCPIIIFCCKKWSLDETHRYKSMLKVAILYIPFTFLFISLMIGTRHLAYLLIEGRLWDNGDLLTRYIYEYPKTIGFYCAIVFGAYTKVYFETYQKEQIHAAKLNEQLLTAQIAVLRNQLQPHFLFNTLNLISSTMYQDVDKADSIIMRLGNLLRYSLAAEQKPWVTFNEELQAMTSFLEIAQLRFGDRLSTKIEIEPQVESVLIPAMLLQPLLENAVKYGIEPSDDMGGVHLKAYSEDGMLCITIMNPLLEYENQQPSFGIGLQNTKERLELLYGDSANVSLVQQGNNSIILTLTLPMQ